VLLTALYYFCFHPTRFSAFLIKSQCFGAIIPNLAAEILVPARQIICGPTANQSEERALERLKSILSGDWVLLSNLSLITGQDRKPSEIDVIAVGPPGVLVIEVKHWDAAWVRDNPERGRR
jgi:hypothetical protein